MAVATPTNPSNSLLEKRLTADIRDRGLQPGDRYLTTDEAAQMLDVSRTTASRVMRQMAKRQVLERRRRLGTLVGPRAPVTQRSGSRMRLIQVFLVNDVEAEYATQELVQGLRIVMPETSVQLNFLPSEDVVDYVEDVLGSSVPQDRVAGVLAISVPREVHRYLKELGKPVVVLGSVFPEAEALPSVDCDNYQVGELIVEYALEKGPAPRIALLTLSTWTAGDNALLQGMTAALAKAPLPADSLVVRSIPEEVAEDDIRRLVAEEARPTILFCRKKIFADLATKVVRELGLTLGKDVHIIGDAYPSPKGSDYPYPCVYGDEPYQESVTKAARLLQRQIKKEKLEEKHIFTPMKLDAPGTRHGA